jgi:hypothetical protein
MSAEAELRALWTAEGVPQARQDQILAEITAKAQPGAMVGPFRIPYAEELTPAEHIDFEAAAHPVYAVACPTCHKRAGVACIRPSGHKAQDAHAERKALADAVFIAQHGPNASIERLPEGQGWRVHPTGYAEELTPAGPQLVIPGCERAEASAAPTRQLSLFA